MKTIYIMVGFPGSGKSTWAKKHVEQNKNTVVVSRDSIRLALWPNKYEYSKEKESLVREISLDMITASLTRGYDVIIDDTNITKKHRELFNSIALCQDARTIIVHCIENNHCLENRMNDPRGVSKEQWEKVINGMRKRFETPTAGECVGSEKQIIKVGGKYSGFTEKSFTQQVV